jgi:hypothetical protein
MTVFLEGFSVSGNFPCCSVKGISCVESSLTSYHGGNVMVHFKAALVTGHWYSREI